MANWVSSMITTRILDRRSLAVAPLAAIKLIKGWARKNHRVVFRFWIRAHTLISALNIVACLSPYPKRCCRYHNQCPFPYTCRVVLEKTSLAVARRKLVR